MHVSDRLLGIMYKAAQKNSDFSFRRVVAGADLDDALQALGTQMGESGEPYVNGNPMDGYRVNFPQSTSTYIVWDSLARAQANMGAGTKGMDELKAMVKSWPASSNTQDEMFKVLKALESEPSGLTIKARDALINAISEEIAATNNDWARPFYDSFSQQKGWPDPDEVYTALVEEVGGIKHYLSHNQLRAYEEARLTRDALNDEILDAEDEGADARTLSDLEQILENAEDTLSDARTDFERAMSESLAEYFRDLADETLEKHATLEELLTIVFDKALSQGNLPGHLAATYFSDFVSTLPGKRVLVEVHWPSVRKGFMAAFKGLQKPLNLNAGSFDPGKLIKLPHDHWAVEK